jgi:hypothetical protein
MVWRFAAAFQAAGGNIDARKLPDVTRVSRIFGANLLNIRSGSNHSFC